MVADEVKHIQILGRAELRDPAEECKQGLSGSDRLKIPEKHVPQNQLSGAHRGSQSEEAISEPGWSVLVLLIQAVVLFFGLLWYS